MKLSFVMSPSNVLGNKFQYLSNICWNSSIFFIKDNLYLYWSFTLSKVFSLVFISISLCFCSFIFISASKSEICPSSPSPSPSAPCSPSSIFPSSPDLNEFSSFPSSLFSSASFSSPFSLASIELSFSASKLSISPPI